MSILMKLQGAKRIGEVEIKFYNKNEASVNYGTLNSSEEFLILLFLQYYGKMLFNLNSYKDASANLYNSMLLNAERVFVGDYGIDTEYEPGSLTLLQALDAFKKEGKVKRVDVLVLADLYEEYTDIIRLVEPNHGKVKKSYSGKLYHTSKGKPVIQVEVPIFANHLHYVPLSVFMFYQAMLRNESDAFLFKLTLSIQFMNSIYSENENKYDLSFVEYAREAYESMMRLVEAPNNEPSQKAKEAE